MQEQLRDALLGPIMADGMSHGLIVIDRDYCVVIWNRWLEKITGVKAEECLGQNLFALFPAIRDRDKERFIRRCVEDQTPVLLSPFVHQCLIPVEIVINSEETLMMQAVSIHPPPDAHSSNIGAVIVIVDVTEQVFREREILRLNRILRAIMNINQLIVRAASEEEIVQGVCQVLTDEGGYAWASVDFIDEAAAQISSVASAGELQNDAIESELHGTELDHCPMFRAIRMNETQVVEPEDYMDACPSCSRISHISGDIAICSIPLSVDETVIGALTVCSRVAGVFVGDELGLLNGIGNDLTFAIQAQRDAEQRREIEERERTLQMQSEEQSKLAAVGRLAAGIAHDFNNILTGIIGHAEMMLMTASLSASVQNDSRMILQQGRRAARLVRQILDFSRETVLQKRDVDLWLFLRDFARQLQQTMPEHIQVSFSSSPGVYTVGLDSSRFQQVLMNLSVNARDAMAEGGQLDIELARQPLVPDGVSSISSVSSEEWFVVSVTDTGTGISPEILPHIYEPFFTTERTGNGSGLGLSQAHGIVSQHGGFIDVKSRVNQGTTFSIYLPAIGTSVSSVQKNDLLLHPQGNGEKVLLIGDEPTVLDVLERMLKILNYQVILAQNTRDGPDVYQERHNEISLILTDAMAQERNGVELHSRLRRISPGVKIIAISGHPLGSDSLPGNADAWIEKPPILSQLAEIVANILGQ